MVKKVRALYDFEAQQGTGELSLVTGDILTLIRTDVGEGWWEGSNARGGSGLFPEAYVEECSDNESPPSMAPPPLPPDYSASGGDGVVNEMGWCHPATAVSAVGAKNKNDDDDWGNAAGWGFNSDNNPQSQANTSWGNAEFQQAYDQESWDSDFDEDGHPTTAVVAGSGEESWSRGTAVNSLSLPKAVGQSGSSCDINSIGRDGYKKGVTGGTTGLTSFNRFSPFVKSGGENFILGKINVKVQENDFIQVVDNGDGTFSWLNSKPSYSCAIDSPQKASKLKGLKSFIAYKITPSFNLIQVSRRYKHFDWLHERFVDKYSIIPIPPLPDKQIQGRYEDEFIEHRMNQLQSFVDRICSHPILSQSEVWNHFMTCTDDKLWKTGKRKAEKDPLVGGSFFMAIKTPDRPVDAGFLDHEIEVFTKFSTNFDTAVRNMLKTSAEQTAKCQSCYKREFQSIGKSFIQLGQAMEQDGNQKNVNLNNAVICTGEAFEEIAKIVDDQPRNDWEPLGDSMHDYRGLLAGWPGILQIHNGAVGKNKECERLSAEGKISKTELTEIANRTDTLSYAILAEVNTFHRSRVRDMKSAHQHFLKEQISYYQKITEKLQDALRMYDNC